MKILLRHEYITIKFDEQLEIIYCIWNENSANITEQEFRNIILKMIEFINKYIPLYVLSNESKRNFHYNENTQKWVIDIMQITFVNANIKKYAIILPQDFVISISTKELIEEVSNTVTKVAYFDTEEEAKQWFITTRFKVSQGGVLKEY